MDEDGFNFKSSAVARSRQNFLNAVYDRRPEIFEELDTNVLRFYADLRELEGQFHSSLSSRTALETRLREHPNKCVDEVKAVRHAIATWQTKHNLNEMPSVESWLFDFAINQISMKVAMPEYFDDEPLIHLYKGTKSHVGRFQVKDRMLTIDVVSGVYLSWTRQWAQYEAGVLEATRDALREFKEWVDAQPSDKSKWPTLVRRRPEAAEISDEHIGWLADFQVCEKAVSEIHTSLAKVRTEPTIREAVLRAAEFIGLQLRPAERKGPK